MLQKTANEQPGTDEQHQRDCDFCGNKAAPESSLAASFAEPSTRLLQVIARIDTRHLDRWHDTERHTCDNRQHQLVATMPPRSAPL
jgi:hypothetical protein